MMSVPFGITAIPTSSSTTTTGDNNTPVSVQFNPSTVETQLFHNEAQAQRGIRVQQPLTDGIAVYESTPTEINEYLIRLNCSQIDVNAQFVIYTVKNGLIRVMHRNSAMRALLRGHHHQQVSNIKFFSNDGKSGDVVGTIGNKKNETGGGGSTLIVWRVYEHSSSTEIGSERLLEISSDQLSFSSIFWHPFNPNQFFFSHNSSTSKQVATLVETTRIQTQMVDTNDPKSPQQQQHAVLVWSSPTCVMDGALQLRVENDVDDKSMLSSSSVGSGNGSGELVDMCWSDRDPRHVLSVHKNGTIVLWDLKRKEKSSGSGGDSSDDNDSDDDDEDDVVLPKKLFVLKNNSTPYSRCLFLPHEQSVSLSSSSNTPLATSLTTCFVTASQQNCVVTVWSAFTQQGKNSTVSPPTLIPPTKLQEINFAAMGSPAAASLSSFVLNMCYAPAGNVQGPPPSSFLLLGSRETGRLYALHMKSEWSTPIKMEDNTSAPPVPLCVGIDYMVPFTLKHPVYSWSVICRRTGDVMGDGEEEATTDAAVGCGFDMQAFAYQNKVIQELTLTHSMCLPPKPTTAGPPGVGATSGLFTVTPLSGPYVAVSAAASTVAASKNNNAPPGIVVNTPPPPSMTITAIKKEAVEYSYDEEDYDIDDVEDEEDAVVVPDGVVSSSTTAGSAATSTPSSIFPGGGNPFANWLGAIAASTATTGAGVGGTTGVEDLVVPTPTPTPPTPAPPLPPQPSEMGMGMGMDSMFPPPPPPGMGLGMGSLVDSMIGTPPGMSSKKNTTVISAATTTPPLPSMSMSMPMGLSSPSQSRLSASSTLPAAAAAAAPTGLTSSFSGLSLSQPPPEDTTTIPTTAFLNPIELLRNSQTALDSQMNAAAAVATASVDVRAAAGVADAADVLLPALIVDDDAVVEEDNEGGDSTPLLPPATTSTTSGSSGKNSTPATSTSSTNNNKNKQKMKGIIAASRTATAAASRSKSPATGTTRSNTTSRSRGTKNKSPAPGLRHPRSKSPKGGRKNNTNNNNNNKSNSTSNNNKTPFPEGTKVTILKRNPESTDSLTNLNKTATATATAAAAAAAAC